MNVYDSPFLAAKAIVSACAILLCASVVAENGDAKSPQDASSDVPRQVGYRTSDAGFSGPSSVQSQLDEDDILKNPVLRFPNIDRSFQPWQDTKKRFNDKYDIQFGFDYNVLSQSISDSLSGEDNAAVGILRSYGLWDLTRKNDQDWGRISWKVDHRHKLFTDSAPADLAGQAGYIGVTGTLFSATNLVLVDLNWQQSFNDGRSGLIAGRFDPSDYMGVLGYANPWTAFSNLAVLLNPSVAFPDASVGIGGGHRLTDQWYVKGSINDANGVVTELDAFDGGAEFFTWGEIGWTPAPDQQYLTNVHMVAWHVDEREDAGIGSARGIMIGANKTTADQRWMGFVRAGWSNGDAPIYEETYTVGVLRKFRRNSDLFGIALNWGDPPDSSLSSQVTGEVFYRVQFAENLAITPSLQLLKDPALNPDDDTILVWGFRVRLTL